MIGTHGKAYRYCDGIPRRQFLQIGAPLLGLGLADFLRRDVSATTGANRGGRSKSVIVIWTEGGISQQDTYDMKPDSPSDYRGMYQPISTTVPGIVLGEHLQHQAKIMHQLSLVRSVHHENGIHAPSAHWMQTGYFGPTLARNAPQKPSMGSVISRALGSRQPPMPAYITIPKTEGFGYQGATYLGKAFDPFQVGGDPNADGFKVPNLSLPDGLSVESVSMRRSLLKQFDTMRRDIDQSGAMEGLDTFKRQALEMVTGDQMRQAFDLSHESPELRDRYGRHQFGQSALLARRLVEAGARCVHVNTGYWDHHSNLQQGLDELLPPYDRALAALVTDLTERGMLDDVLVYSMGEFGRTPRINGEAGRDHWSECFSVLFAGGGVQGGRVVGASERWGGGVKERLVTPLDLLATVYDILGIPLDTHYQDATGRPVSIVGSGQPIRELTS
ncbi:MAG: DUF1501 domain-containing protein [Planctomycetota bacterium]|nr:DUF1501 domain-containing protein [Planctomycetota bacterium]